MPDATPSDRSLPDTDALAAAMARNQRALRTLASMNYADVDAAVQFAAETLAETLGVARVSVWLYDDAKREIRCRGLVHAGAFRREPLVLTEEAYPRYFTALRAGRTIVADDAQSDPRTSEFRDAYLVPLGIRSMLDVFVEAGGEAIGLLCMEHIGSARRWNAADEQLATSAAALLAAAFVLERQHLLERQLRHAQKMEALGLLAGGIAHDVNNVLSVILGEAELLEEQAGDPEAVRASVEAMRSAARRATGLTRKLLTFSRQRPLSLEPLDLRAVVREFEPLARRVAGERVRIRISTPDEPLVVLGDATLLEQVLLNLTLNAVQAMPEGGTLSIEAHLAGRGDVPPDAMFGSARTLPDARACVVVADTGVGIAPDDLARIWDPFFTTRDLGSGLGLAIVHGAIRQMQGAVTVTSVRGHGTRFVLHLVQSAEPVADTGTALPRAFPDGGGARVLLAEDDAEVRRTLALTLERAGFAVTAVESGDAAVAAFLADPDAVDVLVSDIAMPGIGGPAAYERMRAVRPALGAVFLSGYAADLAWFDALRADGADVRFLAKPVARADLLDGIAALVGVP